jgi:hypothetical protein
MIYDDIIKESVRSDEIMMRRILLRSIVIGAAVGITWCVISYFIIVLMKNASILY